jgi:tol-pal system protein YbgF
MRQSRKKRNVASNRSGNHWGLGFAASGPLSVLVTAVFLLVTGCGMGAVRSDLKQSTAELKKVKRELHKTRDRVEELSNQVFILQDRVDSNHIQISRRPARAQMKADDPGPKGGHAKDGSSKAAEGKETPRSKQRRAKKTDSGSGSDAAGLAPQRGEPRAPHDGGDHRDPADPEDPQAPKHLRVVRLKPRGSGGSGRRSASGRRSTSDRRPVLRLHERGGRHRRGSVPTSIPLRMSDRIPVVPMPRSAGDRSGGGGGGGGGRYAAGPIQQYRAAYKIYLKGQYTTAASQFARFAKRYPRHDYADNAVFWLGQCHYKQKKYSRAARAFKRVLKSYPSGNKAPDALLKLGLTYLKLGKKTTARSLLIQVVQIYPQTRVARLAARFLKKLQ